MEGGQYELPHEILRDRRQVNRFTRITGNERPGQTVEQAAAYFRSEYETMFRVNVNEIEPVCRAAQREHRQ